MARSDLPVEFSDLTRFGPEWMLTTEKERHVQRVRNELVTVCDFYETVLPRMDAIIGHLKGFATVSPEDLPVPERNLFYLALTCMEMSHPVDMNWKRSDIDDAFPSERLEFTGQAAR